MSGAGHSHVTDRDAFLRGAVNAADFKNLPKEEPKTKTPRLVAPTNLVRPGTKPYQGVNVKTTTKKKTASKPSVPPLDGKDSNTPDTYEDPDSPSMDDIERAKAILAKAKASGSPFVEYDPPAHTSVAGEFEIDDIDTDDATPATAQRPLESNDVTPPDLIEHACGLPEILREKGQIVAYLIAHGISHKTRKGMDIKPDEQELYEAHSRDQKHKRASLGHFTAALRLWRNGYPINPKADIDLNSLKVGG